METVVPSPRKEAVSDPSGAPTRHAPVAHLVELAELRPALERSGRPALGDLQGPLRSIKVSLRVCLGETTMTVGELMDARSGDLVRLSHAVERPVDVLLEGRVVARGELMAIDDEFALRITDVPPPLAT